MLEKTKVDNEKNLKQLTDAVEGDKVGIWLKKKAEGKFAAAFYEGIEEAAVAAAVAAVAVRSFS